MFEIKRIGNEEEHLSIVLTWTRSFCNQVIERSVPLAVIMVFVILIVSGSDVLSMKKGREAALLHLIVCIICLGTCAVPLLNLSPGLRESSSMLPTQLFIKPWSIVQPYQFSNGYGLFRRMTGVGENGNRNDGQGWGGFPPSVVERPEIILEGRLLTTGEIRELNFRWKPGNVTKRPRQVAPLQPRVSFASHSRI